MNLGKGDMLDDKALSDMDKSLLAQTSRGGMRINYGQKDLLIDRVEEISTRQAE